MTTNYTKYNSFFTLIEVLVVISIIAILASILLPALRKAKETVNESVCKNNQKQCGLSLLLYAEDNKGWTPMPCWVRGAGLSSIRWGGMLYDTGYLKDRNTLTCPQLTPGGFTNWNNIFGMWSKEIMYGQRLYGKYDGDDSIPLTSKGPSNQLVIADSKATLEGSALYGNSLYYHIYGRVNHKRYFWLHHRQKANALFADGHVEACNGSRLNEAGVRYYLQQNSVHENW